jgi:hypothetical protein
MSQIPQVEIVIHNIRNVPLQDLEELHEATKLEIVKRQIKPLEYEVEALRQQIIDMKDFIERNI